MGQPSVRERRRPEVRARLLTAIEELTSGGESYNDVSVERLASSAGIARATFYLYFPEKSALLGAWLEDAGADLMAALMRWRALDETSTSEDLLDVIQGVVAVSSPGASLLEAVHAEAAREVTLRESLGDLVRRATEGLAEHIEDGQSGGWIDPSILPLETAAWLVWALQSGLRDLLHQDARASAPLVTAYVEMAWHVLYTDAPRRAEG